MISAACNLKVADLSHRTAVSHVTWRH